jgi:putative CocE/NonD family hydrolase
LEDFRRLRESGRTARVTIGPWTHTSPRGGAESIRDGLDWLGTHLREAGGRRDRRPVRIFVMGSKRWVDLEDWPPPFTVEEWHLHPGGRLAPDLPADGPPDRYRYDPADPAPGLGGPSLDPVRSGKRNQRRRESRPDVLTYTSEALARDLTVAGPVNAEVWATCDRPSYDVFVRLCDVTPSGRSYNVCDGIIRVTAGEGGAAPVRLALWPTAHTFRAGHRIRVQISSAAHPLYARNLGGGEPLGSGATLQAGTQEIFHDPARPSRIELPVSPILGNTPGPSRVR